MGFVSFTIASLGLTPQAICCRAAPQAQNAKKLCLRSTYVIYKSYRYYGSYKSYSAGAAMNYNHGRNEITELERRWKTDPRWEGVTRPYSAAAVVRLRGSMPIEYTLAKQDAARL